MFLSLCEMPSLGGRIVCFETKELTLKQISSLRLRSAGSQIAFSFKNFCFGRMQPPWGKIRDFIYRVSQKNVPLSHKQSSSNVVCLVALDVWTLERFFLGHPIQKGPIVLSKRCFAAHKNKRKPCAWIVCVCKWGWLGYSFSSRPLESKQHIPPFFPPRKQLRRATIAFLDHDGFRFKLSRARTSTPKTRG